MTHRSGAGRRASDPSLRGRSPGGEERQGDAAHRGEHWSRARHRHRPDRHPAARRDDRGQPRPHGRRPRRRRGARRPPPGRCAGRTPSSAERVAALRPRAARPRPRAGRPGRAVEPELRRVDAACSTPRPRSASILVNINPAYRTHELAYALNQSGCRMLFAAPSFKTSDYVDMVEQVRPELPGAGAGGVLLGGRLGRARRRRRRRIDADARRPAARRCAPDDPINIQYTSGTTGFPKGATLTHRNILNNGYFVDPAAGASPPDDRLCIPVPFYHCFGMVMGNLGCTTHGATMVIPADAFDPHAVLETVQAERCTALYGVPTMFIAELGHPDFDSLRPVDPAHRRDGRVAVPGRGDEACVDRMHMADVTICYGMTETSPVSTQTLPDDSLAPPHGHRRPGPPARRDPHRRPGRPARRSAAARPASSAPAATR